MYFRLFWWDGDETSYSLVYKTSLGMETVRSLAKKIGKEPFSQVETFLDELALLDPNYEEVSVEDFEFE